MIVIILTYRNRSLQIVENCLNSLVNQTNKEYKIILVDYGSITNYKHELEILVKNYEFVQLIQCSTDQQLWCKSRAINIALKAINAEYTFVGDIDMLYHPEFINVLHENKKPLIPTYFQVGFLSKEESQEQKKYTDYKVAFKSSKEATGMTLYNTELLKSINGYDEFYNGWGSEDTDVHVRLQNAGCKVHFYQERLLMLHQWHAKKYRSKNDTTPFHTYLEKINAHYLHFVKTTKKVKANTNFNFGIYNSSDYKALDTIVETYHITNQVGQLSAFVNTVLLTHTQKTILLTIKQGKDYKSFKQFLKKILNKKKRLFLPMEVVNNRLLEIIINNLRNRPYRYQFNSNLGEIKLTIKL